MYLKLCVFLMTFTICSMVNAAAFESINEIRETAEPLRHYWQSFCMRPYPIPDWQSAFREQRFMRGTFGHLSNIEVKQNIPVSIFVNHLGCSRLSFHSSEITTLFSESISLAFINEWTGTFQGMSYLNGSDWGKFDKSIFFPLLSKYQIEWREGLRLKMRRNPYLNRHYNNGRTFPLAFFFECLGLYDKAWRVQLEEGIPEMGGVHQFYGNGYHTGLKEGNRSFYLYAANNAYRAGDKKLGWSFLMSAAVFENEQSFEMAMQTAELWLAVEADKQKLPEVIILSGEKRKKAFLEIVKCYQDMNAHPRAWLFIQEYKNEFDDADALIKSVQDDWLDIVNMVTNPQIANKIVMYGVELYPTKNDPLSIKLPWAFPEGSIEKVKKILKEEAEKIREEEKDDFRFWHKIVEGEERSKAKYESCVGGNVTLINRDGVEIVHKFTELSPLDRNYVRRRLDIARFEKAKSGEVVYPIRTWYSFSGKFSTEARYISSTDKNIQMEKDDGTVITVELSKLSPQDQIYLRNIRKKE